MTDLLSFMVTNYSDDNLGENVNTAAVAAGVIVPTVSMILLLLGTGIIIIIAITVKNKPRQPHYEGKHSIYYVHIL